MSDDDIFDSPGDIPWDALGRINEDGFVDDPSLEDSPVIFDDQFEQRSREIERRPPGMQNVAVTPLRNGPWSGNNQLGIQQRFAPDSNNRQTILKLDEWGFPRIWTVCLGLAFDINNWIPQGGNSASFDVTAILFFGIGGTVQEVEIDWVNGAAISLPFNALNVIAQYNLDVGTEGGGPSEPPLDLLLRASLAHGPLFKTEPTRSFKLTTDALNPQLALNIPPFATAVRILVTNATDIFGFYSQAGSITFNAGTDIVPSFSLASYLFSQLVDYLSVAEGTVGAPVSVPIPTGARSLVFSGMGIATQIVVQFLIGV